MSAKKKTSDSDIVIWIDSKVNESHYFLSNDSSYGFYENLGSRDTTPMIWWPSVTHYIEAKKFEGTQYETTIRKAKTAARARRLTRERSILVTSLNTGS